MTETADKRTPHTDALDTLGMLIDDTAKRDAIHLAVEPMIAGEDLHPGSRVIVRDGAAFYCGYEGGGGVGIVDPFLPISGLRKGRRFWLVLLPRTITSLRHVWEHPDFPTQPGVAEPAPDRDASERWLRDFVARSDCPPYEVLIAKAIDNRDSWSSEYLHFSGRDAHGEIEPEFWKHVEVVTGVKIPHEQRAAYFSCSC